MRTPIGPRLWCLSFPRGVCIFLLLAVGTANAQMSMPISQAPDWVTPAPVPAGGKYFQAQSTKAMAALLARIYHESDWKTDPTKQAERARYYESLLKNNLSFRDEATVRQQLAIELLGAGDSAAAIADLETFRKRSVDAQQPLPAVEARKLGEWLGLSYLRLGEQQNCMAHRGQKSCIFPIRAGGVHQRTLGAEGAVRELTALLEKYPEDDESRWLLNIAYMQLGQYPDKVPAKYLPPPNLYASEFDIGEFDDIALTAGVDLTSHAGGVVMEDFDGDGLLDIMVTSSMPGDPMHLFHNNGVRNGKLTFTDVTVQSGLLGETGGLNLVITDYNNDGRPDVLILRGGWWGKHGNYPMSLLRNDGGTPGHVTFTDVTVEAGLMSAHPTQTAAWADFDGDGWLDVFVGHETNPADPLDKDTHPSQLFRNNHDGTFTEVSASSGIPIDLGYVKGVAWGDFNNDGLPDLYISRKFGRNLLFRNDGGGHFSEVAHAAGVDLQRESFATWFFDYDNDGWPDLFVAGYSTESTNDVGAFELGRPFHGEVPKLYRNKHDGTFEDITHKVHLDRAILTMGANFGDLDNDGWLDLYLGTGESFYQSLLPNRMFRNDSGTGFQDVTTSGGFGHLQKGHAIAFGDLEGNGNEDVFEEMGGAFPGDTFQSILYKNPGHGNHSITLVLEGVKTNRAAFGAKIAVTVRTGSGKRTIYRTVGYGSSFGGNPLRQHIGIGRATLVDKVEVTWPLSHSTQRFIGVTGDRSYHVRELDKALTASASLPASSPSETAKH